MTGKNWKRWMIAGAALSLVALVPGAYAQSNGNDNEAQSTGNGPGYGPGYGPGGYGAGMMGGYGSRYGYGYGPGMMGPGYGYGPGMMGGYGPGYGYGPGMMGGYGPGYGYGPGMMGGWGPGSAWGPGGRGAYGGRGYGMIGLGPVGALNLNADQRTKIAQIEQDVQKRNWDLIGQMHQDRAQLAMLFNQEKVDPNKVGSVYDRIASLHKKILQNNIQARNDIESTLTSQQREQLKQWRNRAFGAPGAGGFGGFEQQEEE